MESAVSGLSSLMRRPCFIQDWKPPWTRYVFCNIIQRLIILRYSIICLISKLVIKWTAQNISVSQPGQHKPPH